MCTLSPQDKSYQERRVTQEEEDQRRQDQTAFLHNSADYLLRFHSEYIKDALLHITY
ncbi:unnamed protein product [Staurois parvus]|uniref:Uncharacterized protein n=1 Tax=Staurois parvus TaxID=386267 RepID=A0ABN9G8W7_9NEOB|nr:unnamed protein product [Staurois parvus]